MEADAVLDCSALLHSTGQHCCNSNCLRHRHKTRKTVRPGAVVTHECSVVTAWCNIKTQSDCFSPILSILCFNNHILKECSFQPGWSKHHWVTALQSFSSQLQLDQVMPRAIRHKFSIGYKTAVLFSWHLISHFAFMYIKAKVVPQINFWHVGCVLRGPESTWRGREMQGGKSSKKAGKTKFSFILIETECRVSERALSPYTFSRRVCLHFSPQRT